MNGKPFEINDGWIELAKAQEDTKSLVQQAVEKISEADIQRREANAKKAHEWNRTHNPSEDPIAIVNQFGLGFKFGGKVYDAIRENKPAHCRACGKPTPMEWSGNASTDNPLTLRVNLVRNLKGWLICRFLIKHVEGTYPCNPGEDLYICGPCVPGVVERIDEMTRPAFGHTKKRY